MNVGFYQVLIVAAFFGMIVVLYKVIDWAVRKWLGFETYGIPFPWPVRWTMFFASILVFFLLLWISVLILGRSWQL